MAGLDEIADDDWIRGSIRSAPGADFKRQPRADGIDPVLTPVARSDVGADAIASFMRWQGCRNILPRALNRIRKSNPGVGASWQDRKTGNCAVANGDFADSGKGSDSVDFNGYCCIDGGGRSINEFQVGRWGGSAPRNCRAVELSPAKV